MTQPNQLTFTKLLEVLVEKFNGETLRFNGSDYSPKHDCVRLTKQIKRVFDLMKDGEWRTLGEIESITGDGQASVSAQLRNLRKDRFGAHTVNKQIRGDRKDGLYEYKLIVNKY